MVNFIGRINRWLRRYVLLVQNRRASHARPLGDVGEQVEVDASTVGGEDVDGWGMERDGVASGCHCPDCIHADLDVRCYMLGPIGIVLSHGQALSTVHNLLVSMGAEPIEADAEPRSGGSGSGDDWSSR